MEVQMERPAKRRGPKRAEVVLSEEERVALEGWARRPSTANALASRARIVLACALGGSDVEVAARLGMRRNTVGGWRKRYLAGGIDGLLDEPRPGRPRTISDAQVEEVIVRTPRPRRRTPPTGRPARWPRRSACLRRRSRASGGRSPCSRTEWR